MHWVSVTVAGTKFSGRNGHQVVVHRAPAPFVYEAAEVVAGLVGGDGMRQVVVGDGVTAPVTVATVTASGGSGALRFEVAGDDAGVATVGMDDGVLVVTNLLTDGTRATITVVVSDATPVNRATVKITVNFVGVSGGVLPVEEGGDWDERVAMGGWMGRRWGWGGDGMAGAEGEGNVAGRDIIALTAAGQGGG